jgi:hypothetical protein
VNNIPAQPASGDDWRRQAARYADMTDSIEGHLERRVAALEEVLAAPWPRRILLAARLRRTIRETNANFPSGTFWASRAEATANDWLVYGHSGGPAIGASR